MRTLAAALATIAAQMASAQQATIVGTLIPHVWVGEFLSSANAWFQSGSGFKMPQSFSDRCVWPRCRWWSASADADADRALDP